jgi:hypothetical protein
MPGVGAVNLAGHSPGHTSYLFGSADEALLFWGDTVHNHAVQLRRPSSRRPLTATKPRRSPAAAGHRPGGHESMAGGRRSPALPRSWPPSRRSQPLHMGTGSPSRRSIDIASRFLSAATIQRHPTLRECRAGGCRPKTPAPPDGSRNQPCGRRISVKPSIWLKKRLTGRITTEAR